VDGSVDMSAKEQLYSILNFIGEEEASQILLYAKESFVLKRKTWDDIEEDEPTPDEIAAFDEYRAAKAENVLI
jgi:hypothetical protein